MVEIDKNCMKYHHLLFPFLVMSGALPPAAADDTQNAGMIAAATSVPQSLDGYTIRFDNSAAQVSSLSSDEMSFAVSAKFAHYLSLTWSRMSPEARRWLMTELFFENDQWARREMLERDKTQSHFRMERLSGSKLFLILEGGAIDRWILLDFEPPVSGSAIWGLGEEMIRDVRFSLSPSYVVRPALAGDPLPQQVECGLFLFDGFALWRQYGKSYFSQGTYPDELTAEPPVIHPVGKDHYENDVYEDQYGRSWASCGNFHYSAEGDNGLLDFSALSTGLRYMLSQDADIGHDEDEGYIYSDAPSLLTLDAVDDGSYSCKVSGYYGIEGSGDAPARVHRMRLVQYTHDLYADQTSSSEERRAAARPAQVIHKRKYRKADEELVTRPVTFRTLCERVLEENTRANWDALEAYYDEHKERFTKLQRELFPLGYFYAGQFKHPTSRHYAKRLTEIIPQILIDGNVRTPHVSGNTALHYSAAMGSSNLTKWLIEQGALINARNQDDQTPLDCLGVSKKGLDKWMIARGAERTHPVKTKGPILKEKGSTSYAAAAAKTPTPAPAPVASLHEQAEKLAHDLIAGVNNDMELLLSCYAERVNYFGQTGFTHEQIRKDNVVFRHKYPKRDFQVRDVTIRKQDENRYRITVMVKGLRWDTADKPQHIELLYRLDARLVEGRFSVFCIRTDIIPKS